VLGKNDLKVVAEPAERFRQELTPIPKPVPHQASANIHPIVDAYAHQEIISPPEPNELGDVRIAVHKTATKRHKQSVAENFEPEEIAMR